MDILKDKIVKIRKSQQCLMCCRKFPIGTEMKSQTNIYDGEIATIYECKTCQTLLDEFKEAFIDHSENIFPADCVCEAYFDYKVNNPEDLLVKMRLEENKSSVLIITPTEEKTNDY